MSRGIRNLNLPSFEDINIQGQLQKRALRNFDRLESSRFHPDQICKDGKVNTWPGDIEGRIVLGLYSLPAQHIGKHGILMKSLGDSPDG